MPALVSFASVLRRSRYRLDISNPVSFLQRVLCPRQPPKLIVKYHVAEPLNVILTQPRSVVKYVIPFVFGHLAAALRLSSLGRPERAGTRSTGSAVASRL